MLCAYYDHTCDSYNLFAGKDISYAESYEVNKLSHYAYVAYRLQFRICRKLNTEYNRISYS